MSPPVFFAVIRAKMRKLLISRIFSANGWLCKGFRISTE